MTGLRPGEVLGLSIDDLDFEQGLIFVRRSAWYSHLISPKSNRSVATVPMPGPLAEVLTNYLASWRPNEKRLLFSNRRGNPYSENKVVQKRLWPILDALAIPRCDARLPALARELARFKRRIAKGRTGSIAARRCEYDVAGLRSRPRIGTTRRGGESGPHFAA